MDSIADASPRQLASPEGRLHMFGRSECRRTGPHVDIGRKAPVENRCARANDLVQGYCCKSLGMLQGQCSCNGDRRHHPCQAKWRGDEHLSRFRKINDPLRHRDIQLKR